MTRRGTSPLRLAPAFLALFALAWTASTDAQEPPGGEPGDSIAEGCATPEHRQFDFWLGRWEVRNPEGELVGHNEITRVARGCGLLERWRGLRGSRGVSVNGYDPDRGRWTQRWIGAGATLWLEGGLEGEAMVLTGAAPRATPQGEVVDRITWTPLPDGRVRQVWEVSNDDGATWRALFVGLYARGAGGLTSEREGGQPFSGVGEAGWRPPTELGNAPAGSGPAPPPSLEETSYARAASVRSAPTRALRLVRIRSGPAVTDAYSTPSASWVDVDGDGDEDLYVLNGFASREPPEARRPQPNALYLNDGDGGFGRIAEHPLLDDLAYSGSSTWGDYDNDGDLDLFVANQEGEDNFLYRNEGDGRFLRITEGAVVKDGGRSFSALWVDADGDGWIDLHVLNGRGGAGAEVDFFYRNRGNGEFQRLEDLPFTRETLRSGGAVWGDLDADGDPDLFLPVYEAGRPPRLYRNDGALRFVEVTSEAGLRPDPLPAWPAASVAHWVDYEDDGDLDLFVGTSRGTIDLLFANDGTGRFERVEAGRLGLDATYVSDAIWIDLENDGDLDLVVAVWGGASEVYLNDGEGGLFPAQSGDFGATVTFASSVSAADVDGDGDLDLYLTQWPLNEEGGAANLLYRNDGPTGNWLKLDLEGTASNRSAIGALVAVTAEIEGVPRRQLRLVTARSSWRAANGLSQHVGLGDAERVDRIEVVWPSGRVNTLEGPIPVNRRLKIVEGGE